MDKRINKLITAYITTFKDSVRNKITELSFDEKPKINELLEFVYDYERLSIVKDDLTKRKRIKNSVPDINRCNAKRSNGEQCTRRRKESCEFCGTHTKGTPHGLISSAQTNEICLHKLEVFAEDIFGIVYYIDTYNNVYKTEDILEGKQNPQIIAKYVKQNGVYTIPEFGLM
jgi:hypothetical protein